MTDTNEEEAPEFIKKLRCMEKGLLRLWIAFSFVWVLLALFYSGRKEVVLFPLVLLAFYPTFIFVIYPVACWVIKGFDNKDSTE